MDINNVHAFLEASVLIVPPLLRAQESLTLTSAPDVLFGRRIIRLTDAKKLTFIASVTASAFECLFRECHALAHEQPAIHKLFMTTQQLRIRTC